MNTMYTVAMLSMVALASASGWAAYDDGSYKGEGAGLAYAGWAGGHGAVDKYGPAPLAHDGRVIDTPDVAHAKAAHLAAHAKAAAAAAHSPSHSAWAPAAWAPAPAAWAPAPSHGWAPAPAPSHGWAPAPAASHGWAPAPAHDAWAPKWTGPPAHIELTHDGKYVKDTPEVAHARAQHLAAHAAASQSAAHYGYEPAYASGPAYGHAAW